VARLESLEPKCFPLVSFRSKPRKKPQRQRISVFMSKATSGTRTQDPSFTKKVGTALSANLTSMLPSILRRSPPACKP
jgi:hypothetical protein